MKKLLLFFLVIVIAVQQIVVMPGCANIIPPAGGPRDSLAPILVKVSPPDSTRNFTEKKISFTFDEFVEIQNSQQEVLVSPLSKQNPVVEYKLNTVTVRLKDTLEENTTYTIDFGNAIKDINEGNFLKNFTYTFSTGAYLDSLEFSGKVILAETGKLDTTLIVMLHSSADDSAVIKEKPRYISKLDGKGVFRFKNLPPKTYHVYALKDEGGSRRYMSDKQLFAFADAPVTISDSTRTVTLYAYARPAAPGTQSTGATLNPGGRLTKGVGGNTNASTDRRLKFSTNLSSGQQDLLSSFIMSFEQPLKVYDSAKVGLFTDSTFQPVTNYRFVKDSFNRSIKLTHSWKENTTYHLVLDKDFAEDSTGKKLLKSDTLSFRTKKLSDYGEMKIRFKNVDMSQNPVVLFILNGSINQSFPLTGPEISRTVFLPGDYELRILYDTNKNGVWDPGDFFGNHKQPELVKPIERRVNIRANWQNEFEIAL
jgi:hypothetical protein